MGVFLGFNVFMCVHGVAEGGLDPLQLLPLIALHIVGILTVKGTRVARTVTALTQFRVGVYFQCFCSSLILLLIIVIQL